MQKLYHRPFVYFMTSHIMEAVTDTEREISTSGDDSPTGPRHNLCTLPAANRGGQGWSSIHDNSHPQRDPRHIEAANYYLDKSIKPRFTRYYVTL